MFPKREQGQLALESLSPLRIAKMYSALDALADPKIDCDPIYLHSGIWLGNDDSSPTRKATGGGLPVEIWSRFMKPAHQGVPVAALPELDTGGFSIATILSQGGAPVPPAPVGASSRADRNTGIDNWLLDRLFGGRR
jgi:penicillin-binding protein 1A